MMIRAPIQIEPTAGMPGAPTVLALIIAVAAAQLRFFKEHLWLPALVERRSLEGKKLHKAAGTLNPFARKLDKWFHGRTPRFIKEPGPRIAGAW